MGAEEKGMVSKTEQEQSVQSRLAVRDRRTKGEDAEEFIIMEEGGWNF
jgi:hypothetical protein